MNRVAIALVLAGCSFGAQPDPPPAPPEVPEAAVPPDEGVMGLTEKEPRQILAVPGQAGLVEALGSVGACREAGSDMPRRVLAWSLPNSGELFAVECSAGGATSWEWFSAWSLDHVFAAVLDQDGQPVRFSGMPEFDKTTGAATWLTPGPDGPRCGDWYRYRVADEKMVLEQHRRRDCAAVGEASPPTEWALVE